MPFLVCLLVLLLPAAAHAASPPPARCGSASPAARPHAVPRLRRIVVVVMENKSCADVIGSRDAPYLSRLEGVYRANVLGGQVREYQVLVDPQALAEQNLSMEAVNKALASAKSDEVRPSRRSALRLVTFVVLLTESGAVPVAMVEMKRIAAAELFWDDEP